MMTSTAQKDGETSTALGLEHMQLNTGWSSNASTPSNGTFEAPVVDTKHCAECHKKFSFRRHRYECSMCQYLFCSKHCKKYRQILSSSSEDSDSDSVASVHSGRSDSVGSSTHRRKKKSKKRTRKKKKLRICGQCEFEFQDQEQDQEEQLEESSLQRFETFSSSEFDSKSQRSSRSFSEESRHSESHLESSSSSTTTLTTSWMPIELHMITYNVWMMPDRVTNFAHSVSPAKEERARRIALALPLVDVVIFQEAFCVRGRTILLDAMAQRGYIYHTPVVGRVESGIRPLDGGVVLVSRFPIVEFETRKFGRCCVGDDRLADKGVLYAKLAIPVSRRSIRSSLDPPNQHVHIFGTHTQAWNYPKAVDTRAQQFRMLQRYIQDKDLSEREPVLLAGDLNVNRSTTTKEHQDMLDLLHCREAHYVDLDREPYSFNSESNVLARPGLSSDGSNELLDYVLYSRDHRRPSSSETWILPLRSTAAWAWTRQRKAKTTWMNDLSDHYPVVAKYRF